MVTQKLKIDCKNTKGENVYVNVGYINPTSTDKELWDLSTAINNVTSNTLIESYRITTKDLFLENAD